MIVFKEPYIL